MRDQQNSENRLGAGGGPLARIGTVGDRGCFSDTLPRLLGRVAEWQTRWLQVPVSFGTWGFKSPFAHNCVESSRGFVRDDASASSQSALVTAENVGRGGDRLVAVALVVQQSAHRDGAVGADERLRFDAERPDFPAGQEHHVRRRAL